MESRKEVFQKLKYKGFSWGNNGHIPPKAEMSSQAYKDFIEKIVSYQEDPFPEIYELLDQNPLHMAYIIYRVVNHSDPERLAHLFLGHFRKKKSKNVRN